MNEQIRDLAEHCDFYVGNEHSEKSHEEKQRIWVEKFAELIVAECAVVAREWSDVYVVEDTAPKQIDVMIKKHFGVEE